METGGDKTTPSCIFCEEDADLTIAHVMIECTGLYYSRINHFVAADMKDLFDRIHPKQIIGFLKEANIYCLIWIFSTNFDIITINNFIIVYFVTSFA